LVEKTLKADVFLPSGGRIHAGAIG
jgi:hypothetical protein